MKHSLILFLKVLLLPFSILYGLIAEIRNRLFDHGLFKTSRFPFPVISVGNITAGGSGKTPFTILLTRYLSGERTVAVVSRGYGRSGKGLKVVSDGRTVRLEPGESGDEPYLIAKSVPVAWVLVAEQRREALRWLSKEVQPDLVILDDAFQHRSVHRDIDIVLENQKEQSLWKLPLPSGRLREFYHNIKRADIRIRTNADKKDAEPGSVHDRKSVYSCRSLMRAYIDLDFNEAGSLAELAGRRIYAFCGIAHTENFFSGLEENGLVIAGRRAFRDHHRYTEGDITGLYRAAREAGAAYLLCTEKDLVKINSVLQKNETNPPLFAVRLLLEMENVQTFWKELSDRIDNIK